MKRNDKITALTLVGFSPTELSRQTNELLDATYVSAKPLMAAKREEIRRVRTREGRRAARRRDMFEKTEAQRKLEADWSSRWSPPPPIRGREPSDVEVIRGLIEKCNARIEENKRLFRDTGNAEYASNARAATEMRMSLQQSLAEEVA